MKSLILIVVLAAVITVYNDAASVPNNRVKLTQKEVDLSQEEGHLFHIDGWGTHQIEDIRREYVMFHERILNMPPIPYTVQRRDIHYRGNSTARILVMWMSRPPTVPGYTDIDQFGHNHLTVRVTSSPGDGLYSHIQFYGHYVDEV